MPSSARENVENRKTIASRTEKGRFISGRSSLRNRTSCTELRRSAEEPFTIRPAEGEWQRSNLGQARPKSALTGRSGDLWMVRRFSAAEGRLESSGRFRYKKR